MNRTPILRPTGLALALCAVLSGCASFRSHEPTGNVIADRPTAVSVDAEADWAWTVSGDNAIRPLQVFSVNGKTYLQMRPGQLIPAVLVEGEPVPFVISAPYVVVSGIPTHMDLVSSGYRAVVVHRGPVQMQQQPTLAPDRVERVSATDTSVPLVPQNSPTRDIEHRQVDLARELAQESHAKAVDAARVWRIRPDQRLLSIALQDWSRSAGIRVVWKSRVDVPITGDAEYREPSFLMAMSRVLADASGAGYRFYFSMSDSKTVTVVALHAS